MCTLKVTGSCCGLGRATGRQTNSRSVKSRTGQSRIIALWRTAL